ncbi:hypothetical protein, partial [Leuconostoc pseudomesenteroides]|uniref:hypothetical protein n=1 Tax=Leuconostoc pseudomesenteroides TaxID=33968 RepID=UPI0040368AFF
KAAIDDAHKSVSPVRPINTVINNGNSLNNNMFNKFSSDKNLLSNNSSLLPHTSVNQKNQDNQPLISVLAILSGIVGINLFKNKKKNK